MTARCVVLKTVAMAVLLFLLILPLSAQQGDADWAARLKEASAKPTPRLPDGHPDLSGSWGDPPPPPFFPRVDFRRSPDGKTLVVIDRDAPELDALAQSLFKERAANRSIRPPYKPEFVTRQRELMYTASRIDPGIHCYPKGVPRLGAPTEIVHRPDAVYLFYAGQATHRIVPIGGKHDPDSDPKPNGDSIAFWDGDTLVIDVINLDAETWLDGDGDFHSDALHVIERFTRKGNTLAYEVMIEDPKLFAAAWKPVAGFALVDRIGSRTMLLKDAGAHDPPDYPCVERDREHKVNNDRF